MKFKSLILFVVFAIFLISCDKDMKRVNPNDEGADLSEIAKICAQNNAECGYIETAIEGKMRSIFCGKCENGSCVSNKCEKTDDDNDTDTTTDSDTDTGSDDSDTKSDEDSDTITDNDTDTVTDDDTDTGSDDSDTDTKHDEDTDAVPDNGPDEDLNPVVDEDETDDSDNSDPILPECNSSTTSFPCRDSSTGHIWSEMASGMEWQAAKEYCAGLNSSNYGGYSSGWRLPTIDELRTLIKNCPRSQTDGSCAVKDPGCLSRSDCWSPDCYYCDCRDDNGGYYSKLGDDGGVWLWSSSTPPDVTYSAWYADFQCGSVGNADKSGENSVRCVRNDGNENPEIPDDDETPDADENPVADDDEIDDSDNSDPTLPKCNSSTASFPCKDLSTGHIWSEMASGTMNWQEANDHCTGLNSSNYGGYSSGWHLPTIDELRTLIQNCEGTQTGGSCGVTESCLSTSCRDSSCYSCSSDSTGGHSKFGKTSSLWSSSTRSDYSNAAWFVGFRDAYVDFNLKSDSKYVRCVR